MMVEKKKINLKVVTMVIAVIVEAKEGVGVDGIGGQKEVWLPL